MNTTLGEMSQEHVSRELWHVESVIVTSNKEMAWAVFWINISGITISRHTAIFINTSCGGTGNNESQWQLVHVQGSSPVALTTLPVPKKLTL